MSWSAYYIGNPDKIISALVKQSGQLTGKSKEEFDAALPHIMALVDLNKNQHIAPVLKLTASGHGSDGYNNCNVIIENTGSVLV